MHGWRDPLERLDVPAERTLHIGDGDSDRDGAAAAGLAFEPVPLATLPERLGRAADRQRKLGLSTRAIHTPPLPEGAGEPLVGPIVASTTFSFEHDAELGAVLAEEQYGFMYSRHRNPTVEELNAVLAELEGAEAAQAFGSGMGAISAALHDTRGGDTAGRRPALRHDYQLIESQPPPGIEIAYLDITDPPPGNARPASATSRRWPTGLPAGRPRSAGRAKGTGSSSSTTPSPRRRSAVRSSSAPSWSASPRPKYLERPPT
jgi:hypothetical protein